MAIVPNKLYPSQMNGPVISANGMALDAEFADAKAIEDYLYGLSIETARDTELDNIGRIIGYPRPLVPRGFNAENILLLGTLPIATDVEIGLATVSSLVGGELASVVKDETNYMSTGMYRKFLTSFAILKRYGITLQAVDKIASILSDNYDIEYDENADIEIIFHEDIGFKNIWILSQLFYRIATVPQILVYSEGE